MYLVLLPVTGKCMFFYNKKFLLELTFQSEVREPPWLVCAVGTLASSLCLRFLCGQITLLPNLQGRACGEFPVRDCSTFPERAGWWACVCICGCVPAGPWGAQSSALLP